MSIYLKKDGTEFTNVYDLLKFGYTQYGEKSWGERFVKTYSDPECTQLECKAARRSFDDLLTISRTYFPETTEVELAKTLEQLRKERVVFCLFCPDIERVVFYRSTGYGHDSFKNGVNENYHDREGTSNYSLNTILGLINT